MLFKFSQFLFLNTERAFEIYENLHHLKISHYTVCVYVCGEGDTADHEETGMCLCVW